MRLHPIGILFGALIIVSCSPKLPTAEQLDLASHHRVIAVLPAEIHIESMRGTTAEERLKAEQEGMWRYQKEMQVWLFKRKEQGRLNVVLAPTDETNAILKKAGHFDEKALTPAEICELLQVDAIVTSQYTLRQPMSTGLAIALGVLFNIWTATNQSFAVMDIHDRKTGQVVWRYQRAASGSAGSSLPQLVNGLMRNASRKLPYRGAR